MRPSRDLFRARRAAGTPDRDVSVAVGGSVRVSDPLYARDLAYEGVGIAYLFEPRVRDNLRAGRLQQVLPAASIEEPGLFGAPANVFSGNPRPPLSQ
jgi:DNA-binding transcriptional LysR family regulator